MAISCALNDLINAVKEYEEAVDTYIEEQDDGNKRNLDDAREALDEAIANAEGEL